MHTGNVSAHESPKRLGLTLFELILALALTSLLLVTISMAINIQLRTFQSRRSYVEDTHLARAILTHIATDLRNAVVYKEFDTSGAESVLADGEKLAEETADELGVENPLSDEENEDTSLTSSVEPPPQPGIYGNQHELQIDTSRLPRVDEYYPEFATNVVDTTKIPSDIKTVTYYVQNGASAFGNSITGQPVSGLMRRELDRAVAQWSFDTGATDTVDSIGELLAPEVVGLAFRYFDGMQWLTEWSTEEFGELPVAVEITLMLLPLEPSNRVRTNAAVSIATDSGLAVENTLYYRMVVDIPLGKPLETAGETTELEALDL